MKKTIAVSIVVFQLLLFASCSPLSGGAQGAALPYYSQTGEDYDEPEYNTEEYNYILENEFLSATNRPLSTFAADVDTASYANVRRMLNEGKTPPADAVRIEEMINYFYYDYPAPREGDPFSVTVEIAPCPWNSKTKLLLIGLQAAKIDAEHLPASNLVFLIDVSGSMDSSNKLPLVQRAFLLLCESLTENDTVSIVTYASSDRVVIDGARGDQKEKIMAAIEDLRAGGSTAGSKGIETAYSLAQEHFIPGGNNRVILATDGDLNVGVTSEGELTRLIEKKREEGVFLSVMGFGTGNIKDNKMEALADHGNGNYSYIDSIQEARRVLVEEMGGTLFTVAKDVKFQVEFNPAKIKGYRLIGYENRRMEDADFDDDTKDGGEIGAGHRVTVLYEIAELTSEQEIEGAPLKYQQTESIGSDEWLTVNIRYKQPDGNKSILLSYPVDDSAVLETMSSNMAFSSAVAQVGMLLRESAYAGSASYADVVKQLQGIPGIADDPYKDELLYLVKKLARNG